MPIRFNRFCLFSKRQNLGEDGNNQYKPYSETTVESRTHLKTVKITLNIFAVYLADLNRSR